MRANESDFRSTPEPPAPTPSATTCARCGKPLSMAQIGSDKGFCRNDECSWRYIWQSGVAPASTPSATTDNPSTDPTMSTHCEPDATLMSDGCATTPNDSACPCGTPLVRDGVTVCSHWTGSICAECEQAIIEKYNARMREAHRD